MKLITYYQTGKIDVFDTATFTATDPFKRDGMNLITEFAIRFDLLEDNSHLKANFTAKKIFQKTNGFAQWATIRQSLTMSYCVENLKQGRKPELTIFTSKKRTFPQAFSVRKSVVQAVEKFLQKEKLYVKRDTNVPFSARPEKKALRTAKVHSYPRSILKAQFSMS